MIVERSLKTSNEHEPQSLTHLREQIDRARAAKKLCHKLLAEASGGEQVLGDPGSTVSRGAP